jgi:hypothetical protein
MPEHPKVVRLSDRAFRLHVQGLCYCQRNLTDGIVPRSIGEMWGRKGVTELVSRGLWIERGEDYEIDNFLEWNDSKAAVEEKRVKDSSRKAKGKREDSERIPNGIPIDTATALDDALVVRLQDQKEAFEFFYDEIYPRKVGRARRGRRSSEPVAVPR